MWSTDLRLKTKYPWRIQARPGTLTWKGSSEEATELGVGTVPEPWNKRLDVYLCLGFRAGEEFL